MKLLETVFVIAIAVIVAVLIYLPFSTFRNGQALSGAAENALSLLSLARTNTVSSVNNLQYGVHFASTTVTLFSGSAYPGTTVQQVTLPGSVIVSGSALAGNGVNVIFDRLTGATSAYGTVTFQLGSDTSKQRIIKIEATGLSYLQ